MDNKNTQKKLTIFSSPLRGGGGELRETNEIGRVRGEDKEKFIMSCMIVKEWKLLQTRSPSPTSYDPPDVTE